MQSQVTKLVHCAACTLGRVMVRGLFEAVERFCFHKTVCDTDEVLHF